MRLVGPQNQSEHFGKKKNLIPLPGFKARDIQPTLLRPPFLDYKLEFILKAYRPTFKYIWSVLLENCAVENKFEFRLELIFSKKVMVWAPTERVSQIF